MRKMTMGIGLLAALAALVWGCGTIMHGTTQTVGIGSNPTGAKITVDGMELGVTPMMVDLKRKSSHLVHIELPGYLPFDTTITKSVSGWVFGNLIFGGIIGLAVDAVSGGLYELSPEQVQAGLIRMNMSSVWDEHNRDTFYVVAVLAPDPSWKKVGELTPAPAGRP